MIINEVVNSNLCTGCGICKSLYSNKVEMNCKDLFNRPKQIKKLTKKETNEFKNICPGIYQSSIDFKSPLHHDVWGQYFYSGKGYSLNDEIRHKSSSGGILSQTAIFLLENNIVSGIIHIGSDPLNPLENFVQVSKTRDEVINKSGSRYSPASPLISVVEIITSNPKNKYAFIGKPCDVTALRQAQKFHENLKTQISIVLSFFCAGTPSREGINKILTHFNVDSQNVKKFEFRGNGWPGETLVETETEKFKMKYEESWGKILGPTIQNRCKICADGIGENADIVSADVWDADERGYPKFEETNGNGLILSRSKIGNDLVKKMIDLNTIFSNNFNLDELKNIQPTQFERKCTIFPRILARKIFFKQNPIFLNQRIFRNMKYISLYKLFRMFIGSILRVKKGNM